tara:strand:+ start:26 stop:244 length:219 start_codon:yes stop_codon:yes gene_type:complete
MATGSLNLTEYPGDMVVVACDRCGRRGRLNKARLIASHGRDAALPDILREIADCAKASGFGNDLCGAKYEGL